MVSSHDGHIEGNWGYELIHAIAILMSRGEEAVPLSDSVSTPAPSLLPHQHLLSHRHSRASSAPPPRHPAPWVRRQQSLSSSTLSSMCCAPCLLSLLSSAPHRHSRATSATLCSMDAPAGAEFIYTAEDSTNPSLDLRYPGQVFPQPGPGM